MGSLLFNKDIVAHPLQYTSHISVIQGEGGARNSGYGHGGDDRGRPITGSPQK